MLEDLKEMLHCIEMNCKHNKCFGGVNLDEEDCKLLLDYIANLQQENEKLKLDVRYWENKWQNTRFANNQVKVLQDTIIKSANNTNKAMKQTEIYKSRCEKAVEYINFVINHYKEQLETPIEDTYFNSDVNRKGYILSIIAYLQTTLDTLIGSDENETK